MEKVSIIIPAYNAEKYLGECLDSALTQTHKNLEIVIVNDGSIDSTASIMNEYAEKYDNIKVIHTENGGVSRARNIGLDNANGDYIMFLDSDDLLVPDAVEILLQDLIDNNADVSIGSMNSEIDNCSPNLEGTDVCIWSDTQALEKSLEDDPFTYSSCAKLYKKYVIDNVRFIEGRKIHEDSYFVFSVFLNKPAVVVRDVVIYKYRVNENSASHAAFSEKYFDILYFAEKKYKIVNANYSYLLNKAKNMMVKSNIAMLQCLLNTNDKKYNTDIKNCIHNVKKYKNYFLPTYPGDRKRFNIVIYNLYGIFKLLYRLKYRKQIKKAG